MAGNPEHHRIKKWVYSASRQLTKVSIPSRSWKLSRFFQGVKNERLGSKNNEEFLKFLQCHDCNSHIFPGEKCYSS